MEDHVPRHAQMGAWVLINDRWYNHYDRFTEEFDQQNDFDIHRDCIGGLLLLPKKINASLSVRPGTL